MQDAALHDFITGRVYPFHPHYRRLFDESGIDPAGVKSVADLELSVRSRKALQRLNIVSVGELASRTEAELLGCKNFGQTSLNEIKQQLASLGMALRKLEE